MIFWFFLVGCEPPNPSAAQSDACADAEGLDWASYGDVFLRDWCRSCHSADNPNRFGAPEGMDFDTLDQLREWKDVVYTSVIEDETMPSGGGITEEERAAFALYLGCRV